MESPNGTAYPIVDHAGNQWTIVSSSVAKNGIRDTRTHGVIGLLYWAQDIYEMNPYGWWKLTAAGWVAATDPRLVLVGRVFSVDFSKDYS